MRDLTSRFRRQQPAVCVQCKGVAQPCDCVSIEERGAVFSSPCRMELMSDLLVSIEVKHAGCCCKRMIFEGVVIGCSKCGDGSYETTVLFLGTGEARPADEGFRHLKN